MMMAPFAQDTILKMLKDIYWNAFKDRKWHIALQVLGLLGRNSGLFERQHLPEVARIAGMTKEQLCDFMEALEKLDPDLKHPPPPMPSP